MSIYKAGLIALLIPATLAGTAMAQDDTRPGPRIVFEEVDANNDGAITLEEIQAMGANRFANADTDGDGALSRDELLAQGQDRIERRVDRMLERLDTDGDGQLSMAEMEEARDGRRGFGRGPNPERMFERFDADGDGSVTQAEFDEGIARIMERRGHNHDR